MSETGTQSWKVLNLGCSVTEAGSSKNFNTGDWRSDQRPITDEKICIKCGKCYILCPDLCYTPKTKIGDYFDWNGFYCKGCGICIKECPKSAISWKKENEEEKYGAACRS